MEGDPTSILPIFYPAFFEIFDYYGTSRSKIYRDHTYVLHNSLNLQWTNTLHSHWRCSTDSFPLEQNR